MSELVNYSTGTTVTSNWLNRTQLREEGFAGYVCYQTGGIFYAKALTPGGTDYSGANTACDIPLQSALTALTSGGTVFVKAGNHTLANQIKMLSGTTLRGEGIGKTIFTLAAGTGNLLATDAWIRNSDWANGNTDILLQDFEVNGNRANRSRSTTTDDDNIWFDANNQGTGSNTCSRIFINRVYSHDSNGHGIVLRYCKNSFLTGTVTSANGRQAGDGFWHGTYLLRCTDSELTGCQSYSNIDLSGFKTNIGTRITLANCISSSNTTHGFEGGGADASNLSDTISYVNCIANG